MDSREALASVLLDHAIAADLVPWACPCAFGPDGRYRLEELVAASPHSLLYRATDKAMSSEGFDAAVAIKVLRRPAVQRDEALTTRRVTHPNVLATLDRGITPEGLPYLVAEFVDGGDLSARAVPLARRDAASLMSKVAYAVQAAHSAGVVHCDLKPANILITKTGEPKLADFGLSRWAADSPEGSRGNLAFMSPEQFEGKDDALTPPSDVYALGGLLFHLLTGNLPHGATSDEVTRSRRDQRRPPSPHAGRDLDLICAKAMAPERDQRYHAAGDMGDDLRRWLAHEPLPWSRPSLIRRATLNIRRHPVRAVVVATLVLAAGVTIGVRRYNLGQDRERQARAQAQAVRLANEQVEATRARVRQQIQWFAQSMAVPGGDLEDRILPSLVWVQWIAESPLIQADGHVPAAGERIMMLRALLADAAASGRRGHLDVMLAEFALAHLLLEEGDSLEATKLLDDLDEGLAPRLAPDDPMKDSLTAMRWCAQANQALAEGKPSDGLARTLREIGNRLEQDANAASTKRLVDRVLARATSPRP